MLRCAVLRCAAGSSAHRHRGGAAAPRGRHRLVAGHTARRSRQLPLLPLLVLVLVLLLLVLPVPVSVHGRFCRRRGRKPATPQGASGDGCGGGRRPGVLCTGA